MKKGQKFTRTELSTGSLYHMKTMGVRAVPCDHCPQCTTGACFKNKFKKGFLINFLYIFCMFHSSGLCPWCPSVCSSLINGDDMFVDLLRAGGQQHTGVGLQPGLPLLLHLPLYLHGAVTLHCPHHRGLRDHQGTTQGELFSTQNKMLLFAIPHFFLFLNNEMVHFTGKKS